MKFEVNNLQSLPIPLQKSISAFNEETDSFRQVHRLIDASEVYVKLHTVLLINFYLSEITGNALSDKIKGILSAGLKTPSLGIWWWFTKEFAEEIQKTSPVSKIYDLEYSSLNISKKPNQPKIKGNLFEIMEGEKNFIQFRNKYAHGATPKSEACQKDIEFYLPRIITAIQKSTYFLNIQFKLDETFHIFANLGYKQFSLSPLLYIKNKNPDVYFFYNDYRSEMVNLLNYDHGLHEKAPELKDLFKKNYPLDEWDKSSGTEDFRSRVEVLVENFEGRRKELTNILKFISDPEKFGFLFIWGVPGIGKSALLARLSQILRWDKELRKDAGFELKTDIHLHVMEYFIRRDMGTIYATSFSNNLLIRLEKQFQTGVKAGTGGNPAELLRESLLRVSSKLQEGEKLILLIDGLDEGEEDNDLLKTLPKQAFPKIIVLYSSRETAFVKEKVFESCDRENRKELEPRLEGLKKEDTRAFLSRYVSKYDIETYYIDKLVEVSEGNPLYIKLVSQELQAGSLKLNDTKSLPKGLGVLYEGIITRYNKHPLVLDFLRLLATAKDFVSPELAGVLLGCSTDEVKEKILVVCRESLQENTLTTSYDDYQLFHESLREFLKKRYDIELKALRKKWMDFCSKRKEFLSYKTKSSPGNFSVYRYAVLYYPSYAYDVLNDEREIHRENSAKILELESLFASKMTDFLESEEERLELFTISGVAEPLQNAIHNLQRILRKQELTPALKLRLLKYSKWYDTEPERLYYKNRDRITDYLKSNEEEKFNNIALTCEMGITPERKSLLLLRGAHRAEYKKETLPKIETAKPLNEAYQSWLEDSGNYLLKRLSERILIPVGVEK